MTSPKQIVEALGPGGIEAIASAVGKSEKTVKNAVSGGKFKAHWFKMIFSLCEKAGVACPLCAFNFTERADR